MRKRALAVIALLALSYFMYWVWNNLGWGLLKAALLGGMIGPVIYLLAFAVGMGPKAVLPEETEPKETKTSK